VKKEQTRPSELNKQVGGAYYKTFKFQPYEFFFIYQIPHHKAAIIRRILRYRAPNKGLIDLQKILHEIDIIVELEDRDRDFIPRFRGCTKAMEFIKENELIHPQATVITKILSYDTYQGHGREDLLDIKKIVKVIIAEEYPSGGE